MTFLIEFPFSSFPKDFSCDSLSAAITYLDDSENFMALHNFTSKDFSKDVLLGNCKLRFDVENLL